MSNVVLALALFASFAYKVTIDQLIISVDAHLNWRLEILSDGAPAVQRFCSENNNSHRKPICQNMIEHKTESDTWASSCQSLNLGQELRQRGLRYYRISTTCGYHARGKEFLFFKFAQVFKR